MAKSKNTGHEPTGPETSRATHETKGHTLLTVDEVPEQYKEKFLLTGYRRPNSSFHDSIMSAFRLHNETLNVWTHFIPFLVLSVCFWKTFPSFLWPVSSISSRHYPLLVNEISILAFLFISSVAHLCNCMTPRIRHICFYFDYVAICVYGVGTSCAVFSYSRPLKSGFIFFRSQSLYMAISYLCTLLTCYINCASRHRWERIKYVVRTAACILPFTASHLPGYYRFLECAFTGEECSSGLPYAFASWTLYLIAASLNASRVPECYCPRTFDIFGHNHQWVHVITAFGTVAHVISVARDMVEREELLNESLHEVSFSASLVWLFGALVTFCMVALWFGSRLSPSGHLKTDRKKQ